MLTLIGAADYGLARLAHCGILRPMKSRRVLLIAAAVGGAAVVAVVLDSWSRSGGSSNDDPTSGSTGRISGSDRLDRARSQASHSRATRSGKRERAGRRCSSSRIRSARIARSGTSDTLPTVVDEFVRTGKLKLVYRGIPIIGPNSINGLRAMFAAGQQNKLWNCLGGSLRHAGRRRTAAGSRTT